MAGGRFNQFSQNATRMVAAGKSVEEAKQELLDEVRGNFASFLAEAERGKPFCYWFGPTNVHRKWIKGSGKALWGIDPDALEGKLPPFLPDVPEVREDLADYFGEIAAFDAALGVLLDELEQAGQLDNTLVVVSGDHGPPGFPHGKCNLYDFGTAVSLAIAGPGVRGGRVVDDFVNLPDLAPTFLEAGGVDVPDVMTARSLWPVLKSDREGLVDPRGPTSSPAASATWRQPARGICRIRNEPSARPTTCSSSISARTAIRWATRTVWTVTIPPRRKKSPRTPLSHCPTKTLGPRRPGLSTAATIPNGNPTSTTRTTSGLAKSCST